MTTEVTFTVTDGPREVAGNMHLVQINEGPMPIAACFDREAAQRIADLLNAHGLADPAEFDWNP